MKGARQAEELRLCQLLAIQYENREDEVRAKEHQARAEKVLEDALKWGFSRLIPLIPTACAAERVILGGAFFYASRPVWAMRLNQ